MSVPVRRRRAAAIALAAGVTAGAALLTACGSGDSGGADSATTSPPASGTGAPGANAASPANAGGRPATSATAKGSATAAAPPLNGTAHGGLTISDGSRYVVMGGARVDFGTAVRDLAWSPDGREAAFVDGDGDLAVSGADGGGRVVVARNPGGQTWSHPTWQVRPADPQNGYPAANNIIFAVRPGGGSPKLYVVPATAHDAAPKVLPLNPESGVDTPPLPRSGNVWPSGAGRYGTSVYANQDTGHVYIRDDYLRQQGSDLTPGSEPALSPAADEDIVFVRSVGGHDHLFVEHSTDAGPTYRDLTPHAASDYTEPAWSPDGHTVAARTAEGVVTLPADGSREPVLVSGYHGLPAYRSAAAH